MGYRDPETEGPAAHAASAVITLQGLRHELSDVQMLAIFTEIAKAVPEHHKPPTRRTWTRFLDKTRTQVDRATITKDRPRTKTTRAHRFLTQARARSIHARLDKAAPATPNARLWFAIENLEDITAARAQSLGGYLDQIARIDGRDLEDVTIEFRTRHAETGSARQNRAGRRPRTLYYGHLPSDYATITTLANMRREALQRANSAPLAHIPLAGGFIDSYAHDPDTGRLEVTLTGTTYAYRIPASVAEHIKALEEDGAAISNFISSTVFPDPAYAWNDEDGAVRLCPACTQAVGDIHPCPGPIDAPYSDPVLVNLAIGDEVVTPEGNVFLLPPVSRLRADLARSGTTQVPVVVFDATQEQARDVLGAGVTITGEVTLTTAGPTQVELTCSCPLAQCIHLDGVGGMVHEMVLSNQVPGPSTD